MKKVCLFLFFILFGAQTWCMDNFDQKDNISKLEQGNNESDVKEVKKQTCLEKVTNNDYVFYPLIFCCSVTLFFVALMAPHLK